MVNGKQFYVLGLLVVVVRRAFCLVDSGLLCVGCVVDGEW